MDSPQQHCQASGKTESRPNLKERETGKQILPDLGNVKHALGLVEGWVSSRWVGFQGHPEHPWRGRGSTFGKVLGFTPASSPPPSAAGLRKLWHLWRLRGKEGRGWISTGPFLDQSILIPGALGGMRIGGFPVLKLGHLGAKVEKEHNLHEKLNQSLSQAPSSQDLQVKTI